MKLSVISQLVLTVLPALAKPPRPGKHRDLHVQAGSHVIFSYPGLTPPPHLFDLTREGKVGGIILFGENVDENVGNVVQEFQKAYAEGPAYSGSPLLMLTDQEGGKVRRLPGGPERTAKEVGQSPDPEAAATETGEEAANVLKASYVNGNLAPVLDVFRTPENFLDAFGRSYSNDSSVVSVCATAFLTAEQEAGVVSTAKHFPGLGAAGKENTDIEPVVIDTPLEEIQDVDEAPYISAIEAGVEMVMTSWARYTSLDPERPAGMSRAWIMGELRTRLGFKGVTITDAIEAGSLVPFGDHAKLGFMSAEAGMDLLLASGRNVTQGEVIVDALVAGLKDKSLSRREFDAGTKRIFKLRSKLEF